MAPVAHKRAGGKNSGPRNRYSTRDSPTAYTLGTCTLRIYDFYALLSLACVSTSSQHACGLISRQTMSRGSSTAPLLTIPLPPLHAPPAPVEVHCGHPVTKHPPPVQHSNTPSDSPRAPTGIQVRTAAGKHGLLYYTVVTRGRVLLTCDSKFCWDVVNKSWIRSVLRKSIFIQQK